MTVAIFLTVDEALACIEQAGRKGHDWYVSHNLDGRYHVIDPELP
jgi:hypothetical protein